MAVIAGVAATNMGSVLAFGDRAVVAGVAGTYYLGVIHPVCRCEELTVMTVFTNGRLYMCRTLPIAVTPLWHASQEPMTCV